MTQNKPFKPIKLPRFYEKKNADVDKDKENTHIYH